MTKKLWWPLRFIWQLRQVMSLGLILRVLLAAWTTPPTIAPGYVFSAVDYNAYVQANLMYLFSGRPGSAVVRINGSDYSTSSASFVNVDGTNLSFTLTISSGKVLILFGGRITSAVSISGLFDVLIDATRVGNTTNGLTLMNAGSFSVAVIKTGLSVGSHTFSLQWFAAGGTAILSSTAANYPVVFAVAEIG